jgi:predicted Zn finger-like uncharacterized protein
MILTCPNCSRRFKVGAAALGSQGRRVKCGRCAHVWQQLPEGADADESVIGDAGPPAALPDLAAPTEADDKTAWPGQLAEPGPAVVAEPRRARPPGLPWHSAPAPAAKRFGSGAVLLVLLLLILGAGFGAFIARDHVVAAVPGAAKVYALFGTPAEVPGAGLELRGLESERRREDGVPVLVIRGEIVNLASESRTVPALRGSLHGVDGAELTSWRFATAEDTVAAGRSVRFETEVRDPPLEATDLSIRFVDE